MRQYLRRSCPRLPGVYGMFDSRGDLIYIGKAKRLRTRLLSYFRARGRDARARRIVSCARTVAWEVLPSEFAALLRELELIHGRQPRFNIRNHPGRRRNVYVCLGRLPAPYVHTARRPIARGARTYGPVPAGAWLREAIRRINDCFQLRDCPQKQEMVFADEIELFAVPRAAGCLRHEIGTCLGPCAAACSRAQYAEQVNLAQRLLDGEDKSLLHDLRRQMSAASAALDFERASVLRDQFDAVQRLWDFLALVRDARKLYSFLYPVTGHDRRRLWYVIHQAKIMAVLRVPQTAGEARKAAATVRAIYEASGDLTTGLGASELDAVLLLRAWFRKFPKEENKLVAPERNPFGSYVPVQK
jgi:excinuclease ABC subunit C